MTINSIWKTINSEFPALFDGLVFQAQFERTNHLDCWGGVFTKERARTRACACCLRPQKEKREREERVRSAKSEKEPTERKTGKRRKSEISEKWERKRPVKKLISLLRLFSLADLFSCHLLKAGKRMTEQLDNFPDDKTHIDRNHVHVDRP